MSKITFEDGLKEVLDILERNNIKLDENTNTWHNGSTKLCIGNKEINYTIKAGHSINKQNDNKYIWSQKDLITIFNAHMIRLKMDRLANPKVVSPKLFSFEEITTKYPYIKGGGFYIESNFSLRKDVVEKVADYMTRCEHSTMICTRSSSYGLKHYLERLIGEYVSNGEMIIAMLMLGFRFKMQPVKDSPNCYFNLTNNDIKLLHDMSR